uniref:Uncharacterized protein n=1 Tax=viral metagenome TaxID=1070528 RepID=A0A6C0E2U9_9ZZZZ
MENTFYLSDQQRKFIGSNIDDNPIVQQFFSKNTVDYISKKITSMTKNVDERGRQIILPDDKILHLMNTVYLSYNPRQGFDQFWTPNEYLQSLIGQTITQAVFDIKNVLGYEQCVAKYTVWDTILGDYNNRGMRSYAPIKLKEKRPNSMEFNMHY